MEKISFGTDGWRGVIAKDFTLANVAKVAYAVARWLNGKFPNSSVVIGYDCRFGGEMFMEAIAKILASKNIQVYLAESFVSTPMVSLGVLKLKAQCGLMITASHNSAEYNGIKLKNQHGGPMLDKDVKDIENLISNDYEFDLEMLNWNYLLEQGYIHYINLESIYLKNIRDNFDIERLANCGLSFAFDAMYGSAQNIIGKLLPETKQFGCEMNPSFKGVPPEPLAKNLHELEEYIWKSKKLDAAFAVDGDGDRVACFDELGNYLDSHHVLVVLLYCLVKYSGLTGKVVVSATTTTRIEKLCTHFNLEVLRTPVGFKEISAVMLKENILLGGEESGGMTVGTYIPDRDGIWIGLTIWNYLAETGKKFSQIIEEAEAITGKFACERLDLDLNKNIRNKLIEKCISDPFTHFGEYPVQKIEQTDGFKFIFDDERSVIIRASGTQPVIRIYAEAQTRDEVFSIINAVVNTINVF